MTARPQAIRHHHTARDLKPYRLIVGTRRPWWPRFRVYALEALVGGLLALVTVFWLGVLVLAGMLAVRTIADVVRGWGWV